METLTVKIEDVSKMSKEEQHELFDSMTLTPDKFPPIERDLDALDTGNNPQFNLQVTALFARLNDVKKNDPLNYQSGNAVIGKDKEGNDCTVNEAKKILQSVFLETD